VAERENKKALKTTSIRDHEDVRAHFDANAPTYADAHGDADRLLRYRLGIIRRYARLEPDHAVLEVGCGDGMHLRELADEYGQAMGVDISSAMVEVARNRSRALGDKISFGVGHGEKLEPVEDASMDTAFCVGALEHMLDQGQVIKSVARTLKPGGRFVCMTPNGGYIWYRRLAPLLRLDTRHLSTDNFLTSDALRRLFEDAGFGNLQVGRWTFVPRGDMPGPVAALLQGLDRVGRCTGAGCLRGGIVIGGDKPR